MLILTYADGTKYESSFYSSILYSLWPKALNNRHSINVMARNDSPGEFLCLHIIPAFFPRKARVREE